MARRAACLALLCALPQRAFAHQSSVAYSDIAISGRDVVYTLQIASSDLYEAVGVPADRPVTRDEVLAGRGRLFQYLADHLHVETAAGACPVESSAPSDLRFVDKTDGFLAQATLRFHCARAVEKATVRYDLFFDLDARHQGIAHIAFDGAAGQEQIFRADARTLPLLRDLTAWDHAADYLLLGVEHIFTGYDHIAFLLGLLFVAGAAGLRRGARRVLAVVTAFTVAHSITLIASALGAVHLPSRMVESAIAASIVYVGVENLVIREPRRRWLLTFGFGLVHGFGFASVLREIGLPQHGLLLSLLAFNGGVELGQLAVVAAVLPLCALATRSPERRSVELAAVPLLALATFFLFRKFHVAPIPLGAITFVGAPVIVASGRRVGYDRAVRLFGSSVIALCGAYWLVERVTGRVFFNGNLG